MNNIGSNDTTSPMRWFDSMTTVAISVLFHRARSPGSERY